MDKAVESVKAFITPFVAAAFTALSVAYIAQYDLGLSRQDIRTIAVVGAVIIAVLVAVEFYGKRLRKPN